MLIEHQSREIVQNKLQQFVNVLSFKCEIIVVNNYVVPASARPYYVLVSTSTATLCGR